jgi:predicted metal-dependent peptidase
LQQAATLAQGSGRGNVSGALSLFIQNITEPQLDWRSLLWRFLVRTPVDFSGFDRRLVGRGLYLEALEGESVSVRIAVDTSGSVDSDLLGRFLSEVRGILRMYPHLDAQLFYADAELHGPYELNEDTVEMPVGGGGTCFEPFFAHQKEAGDAGGNTLLIYLTDGFGSFPESVPEEAVLWVVPPGGLATEKFPFGEVARLWE